MEEPKVITIDDVIDSTVMHINKGNPLFARESKGNPHGTQGEPSNGDNSAKYLLLTSIICHVLVYCFGSFLSQDMFLSLQVFAFE